MVEQEQKTATQKTQDRYSESKFREMLQFVSQFQASMDPTRLVDELRNLAEFLVYSE